MPAGYGHIRYAAERPMHTQYEVEVTLDDFHTFTRVVARRSTKSAGSRSLGKMVALWLALVAVMTLVFTIAKRSSDFSVTPNLWAGGVVGLVFVILFAFFLNRARSNLRPADSGPTLGIHQVHLSDEGVRDVTRHTNCFVSWAGIRELIETETHIFLMTDTIAGMILPKRGFDSKDDASALCSEANRQIGSAA
jgi:hypothetical protein